MPQRKERKVQLKSRSTTSNDSAYHMTLTVQGPEDSARLEEDKGHKANKVC